VTGTQPGRRGLRAPATRDQADAYRFGLRRLEAALVRGDPVPLHEQVRSQRRAVGAGVVLGALGLAAAALWSLFAPRPEWTRQAVVVGEQSGAMYVVTDGRLVPVANLVAARLVHAALRGAGAAPVPVTVPDDALAGAPRTPAADVPGAPATRPDAPGLAARWGVCDQTAPTGGGRARLLATTVVAGVAPAPRPVDGAPGGVLLDVGDGGAWLVVDGRRHRVDRDDPVLRAALGLAGVPVREASAALASALPEGVRLQRPQLDGVGGPGPGGLRERVGDLLLVRRPGAVPRPHVVLADGIQEVSPVLAQVLGTGTTHPARTVEATDVAAVPVVERAALHGWPETVPRIVDAAAAPLLCWSWSDEAGAPAEGVLLAGSEAAPPKGAHRIPLAQADGPGPLLDAVVLGGAGGPARAVGPGAAPGAGTLYLISETGVAYRVVGPDTARALGIGESPPAPEGVLRWLPGGPALDVARAAELVDVPGVG